MDFIKHKTARDVLKLLRRIDNGDTLTEDVLQNLNRIATADFSGIRLTSLPESISELTQLTELDVSNNQLTSLPESVRELSQLTYLDLSCNPLKTLPDWLGDMSKLSFLDLSKLRLTAFPSFLLKLNLPFTTDTNPYFQSECICIKDTKLSIQPISLFDQSRDKSSHFQESRKLIEDYFETPKEPVREAKVIFLGDGKVGKTYTIQRLLHDCQKGDYPTKETHGILIEDLYAEKMGNLTRYGFGILGVRILCMKCTAVF